MTKLARVIIGAKLVAAAGIGLLALPTQAEGQLHRPDVTSSRMYVDPDARGCAGIQVYEDGTWDTRVDGTGGRWVPTGEHETWIPLGR